MAFPAASAALCRQNGRYQRDPFANITTLKLFGTAAQNDGHIRSGFDTFLRASLRMAGTVTNASRLLILISGMFIVLFGALPIALRARGLITVGAVTFTLGLVLRLNQMPMGLLYQLNVMMRNFGVAQNAASVISIPHALTDMPGASTLTVPRGAMRFEGVSFNYHAGAASSPTSTSP